MARVLVILPTGSYRASDYVAAADAAGIELALASEEAPPLGLEGRFVSIDCSDVERSAQAIADLASSTPIDAIVSADDAGVVMAARASELIGLTHNPPSAAAATRDKAMMRRILAGAEVPQPLFDEVTDAAQAVAAAGRIGFPVVVKPVGLSASRGVIRADDPTRLEAAVTRIRSVFGAELAASGDRLLVERFVPGAEISLEGIIRDGRLEALAIFDKPDPLDGPFFQETLFVTPTALPPDLVAEVERVTQAAVAALELRHGPIHAELRIEDDHPVVIEMAARTIGGLCGRSLTFGLLGSSLEELVLRHAVDPSRRPMRRTPGSTGAAMLPIDRTGTLVAIDGADRARSVDGVWSVEITTPIGARVVPPPDGDRYLGFVFARGSTRDEVVAALRQAMAAITVDIV